MGQFKHPYTDDVQTAYGATADWLLNQGYTAVDVVPVADLKGEQLDDELKAHNLPTTGKADEKRQRLADHLTTIIPPVDGIHEPPTVIVDAT
jgi:hypothetical protein